MVKEVDLLSYWMPVLRQLKEFKEIAKAEEPELKALLEACNRALSNFFITTADEQGISRFEEMLGISSTEGVDLETRRLSVLTAWASKEVYTEEWLYDKLASLCGGRDKVDITTHYEDYSMDIAVELGVKGAFEILTSLISDILPCNLVYTLKTYIKAKTTSTLSVGVAVSTGTLITINSEKVVLPTTSLLGNAVVGTMVVGTR